MRRDLFHYFEADQKTVYQAYLTILKKPPFKKVPAEPPYTLLSFGIGFSFKFNMNGAGVHVHFAPKGSGTAVQVRFSIAQLFGARYQAYDKLMTDNVGKELGVAAMSMDALENSYFESSSTIETPSNAERPNFCPKCGAKLDDECNFCPKCGNKIG